MEPLTHAPVEPPPDFATALRRLRRAASLTQEALAHRSGLSVEGISALERGQRLRPRRDTVALLSDALELSPPQRRALLALARSVPTLSSMPPTSFSASPPSSGAGPGCQLPPPGASLVGRDRELDWLTTRLTPERGLPGPRVVSLVGPPGVGCSTLAVQAALAVREHFPDGQLYLDLHGHSAREPLTAGAALAALLGSLGVAAPDVPVDDDRAAALFRARTAQARLLVLLDNAADTEQVESLVPASSGAAVLVTSRCLVRPRPLDGRLAVAPLAEAASLRLLADRVGVERISADTLAAQRLSAVCAGLPLALTLVADRLLDRPGWPLSALADWLTRRRLAVLSSGHRSVADAVGASLHRLDPLAGEVIVAAARRPAHDVHPRTLARSVHRPVHEVEATLDRLVECGLLDPVAPGHYRLHPLVHAVAREWAPASASHGVGEPATMTG